MEQVVDRILEECPLCGKEVYIETRLRKTIAKIKGELITYVERYNVCPECGDSLTFVPGKMMDENLLAGRDSYRASHNLLTSKEIAQIRNRYGLGPKELSLCLGWEENTVSRYETKEIQNAEHDQVLRALLR